MKIELKIYLIYKQICIAESELSLDLLQCCE